MMMMKPGVSFPVHPKAWSWMRFVSEMLFQRSFSFFNSISFNFILFTEHQIIACHLRALYMLMSSPYSATEKKKETFPLVTVRRKRGRLAVCRNSLGSRRAKREKKYYWAADTCRKAEAEREAREETAPTTGETSHKVHNIQYKDLNAWRMKGRRDGRYIFVFSPGGWAYSINTWTSSNSKYKLYQEEKWGWWQQRQIKSVFTGLY